MIFKKFKALILSSLASFLIVAGWNWYHLNKHNHLRFVLISIGMWCGIMIAWYVFKIIYRWLTARFHRHSYWQNEFYDFLDQLYLTSSLLFLIFFSRSELITLIYATFIFLLIYYQLNRWLKKHPGDGSWVRINSIFFLFGYFIFLVVAALQYWSYYYYILDPTALIFNIVFFRAWSITMFWLAGFALCGVAYWALPKFFRYLPIIFWSAFFVFYLIFWVFNAGILYFSGLYLSPVIMDHAEGGSGVMFNRVSYFLVVMCLMIIISFFLLLRKMINTHYLAPRRYWYYYNTVVLALAAMTFLSVASFWNSPEYTVIKSFYENWRGDTQKVELNPVVQQKLERFGLNYNTNEFYIAHKDKVYTTEKKLLPTKFNNQRPNIMMVLLESFSARLVGVYNPDRAAVTPNLDRMAADPHTTIFTNYFNASTPTVTGLLSQLCSILPPTGHNEIQNENRLQQHHLLCLPQVLEDNGYKYSAYVTAVEKNFAHKDRIFASMGTQEFYGTEELYQYISGEPLSWGWSDHQLFPVTWKFINEKAKEPWLMMLSTVDTHPPFTLAKDMVKYQDGSNDVLNSVHTTDDAFGLFWEEFKHSKYYDNTILVIVADHAIFPAAYKNDKFPAEAGKLTFYDRNTFMVYIPDNILPKTVDTYASEIDVTPTLLNIIGINVPNNFEGHSIFDDRKNYPDLLGMHEFGFWINQEENGKRKVDFIVPQDLQCDGVLIGESVDAPLTMCEYKNYYQWKRQMFEEGRFWFNSN